MSVQFIKPCDVRRVASFGPGALAKLFGVSARTVVKWIDTGLLKAWRIPGSQDRRVRGDELLRFIAAQKLPDECRQQAENLISWRESEGGL